MKKQFTKPTVEIIDFGNVDIITCSGETVPQHDCNSGHNNWGFGFWFFPWNKPRPWKP